MYGAEAVILNLSRLLQQQSHSSVLAVFSNSANPNLQLYEAAIKEGIESHLIACKGQIDRSTIAGIRELAIRTRADLVHAHGYKADIYSYFALRWANLPLVSTCHTWYDNDLLVTLYGWADRKILRHYAAVVAVSGEVKQRLLRSGVAPNKIHLIQNGIDLRPFDSAPPSLKSPSSSCPPLLVGLIGRLSVEKGIDIFLHAAAQVLAQLPSTKFVVVGDGPDRQKLMTLIESLNLQQSVSMLGHRDDMPSVYASLDIAVSSSRQEGLPMAILEGMASSRPWIATAVGDVPTVILDDVTGVLVRPNDIESLSSALIALLQDAGRRNRLGSQAHMLVEKQFSAQRMSEDYLDIYRQCLKNTRISY
jgi:glycosyltransferase involved in cell wall biosynthesis